MMEEVRDVKCSLKNLVNHVIHSNDPKYVVGVDKVEWFDSELAKSIHEHWQLIQGIKKDILGGSLLHSLPPNFKVIFLDGKKGFGEGSYGKI